MLDWNALHPYNAIHFVRIAADFDLTRLRSVIDTTLDSLGLTNLTLDLDRRTYQFQGGAANSDIRVLACGEDASSELATEIELQLNTPFPSRGRINPFRFFVAPATKAFTLGLIYFHPVADAEAIVRLLKQLVDCYQSDARPVDPVPFATTPGRTNRHPGIVLKQIVGLPALFRAARTFSRAHYHDSQEMRNGFTFFSLEANALGSLRATAKTWGVTLNDLFLALLMNSLLPFAATKRSPSRNKIALGCIVNIRRELGVVSRTFGLFLGSFMVAHEVRDDLSLEKLARAIGRQTGRIKAARLYLATPVQLAVVRLAWRFFSTKRTRSFYQKQCPLWGGITNMNINPLWEPTSPDGPPDYFRAVSTGPATPLVFSVTTAGDRVNIGLSYRTTVFSATEIQQVQSRFVTGVTQLEAKA
jgi:hypothetical protein